MRSAENRVEDNWKKVGGDGSSTEYFMLIFKSSEAGAKPNLGGGYSRQPRQQNL
jgi:hypothetical protein